MTINTEAVHTEEMREILYVGGEMNGNRSCPLCGSRLDHLEGRIGNISICSRCRWSRMEMNFSRKTWEARVGMNSSLAGPKLRAT